MQDRELRNAILLLVKAHKMRQSKAAALRILCQAMVDESENGNRLSIGDLEKELPKILAQIEPIAQEEARQIEIALEGDGEFLEPLRVYASQQFWNPRPKGSLV